VWRRREPRQPATPRCQVRDTVAPLPYLWLKLSPARSHCACSIGTLGACLQDSVAAELKGANEIGLAMPSWQLPGSAFKLHRRVGPGVARRRSATLRDSRPAATG
jgi:hypothetical protein